MTYRIDINPKIRTIIVDDEQPSREALANYIAEYCPSLEVVAECNSAKEAFKAILENKPQLVFLDIEMPKGTGFDLLRMFSTVNFKVIFVTAYSQYAIDAFRFAAVDYLLKPIKIAELVESVERIAKSLKPVGILDNLLELVDNFAQPSEKNNSLIVSDSKGFTVLKMNEVVMFKAEGYCTVIFLANDTSVTSSRNLQYYEEIIDQHHFMRVHHSYIINLDHVKSYTYQEEIILTNNLKCSLSRVNKKAFKDHYKNRNMIE